MERSGTGRWRRLPALIGAVVLMTAVPAAALNVLGTNGNDVLRGTKAGDWINGKRGNDRIFGLAGNDILTGGPGADYVDAGAGSDRLLLRDGVRDRAVCGAGRDVVVADQVDIVRFDCEVVSGPSEPNPQPPPPLPPPPPPPPPASVTPGSYKGQTQSGNFVFFDVLENRTVRGWRVNDVRRPCDGPLFIHGAIDLGPYAEPIDRDGRFVTEYDYSSSIVNEKGEPTPAQGHVRIAGIVQGSSASGTVLSTFQFVLDGHPFRCSNGDERWTANRLP